MISKKQRNWYYKYTGFSVFFANFQVGIKNYKIGIAKPVDGWYIIFTKWFTKRTTKGDENGEGYGILYSGFRSYHER